MRVSGAARKGLPLSLGRLRELLWSLSRVFTSGLHVVRIFPRHPCSPRCVAVTIP